MQATLLGVGIAIILALVAALVGPLFVDWSRYRVAFEVEASRVVGMPVRVTGAIDARLLPSPSVVLRGVEVGRAGAEPRMTARELGIELGLGPLVRGEFRAAEMRLVGPELRLGLDDGGRLDWPPVQTGIEPDQLSIERFAVEDGRAVLTDGRTGARFELERLWFNGEVRSLSGPVKGEGAFLARGERYGYRVSAGRLAENGTIKLRLALDPSGQPVALEADGVLRLETAAPKFEGTVTLARPAGIALGAGRGVASVPWRATGRVKANPASALLEQVEFQYGPEERAIKLAGVADVKFGKSPRFNGILSAREVDLDRALDLPEPARRLPLTAIRAFADTIGGAFRLPMPVRLGVSIDAMTVAGGAVQAVRGDIATDADGLDLETFEFRAPGQTQVRVSGRVAFAADDTRFKGPATVEASDPKALVAWLEGRSEASREQIGSLRASGELAVGANGIAIDRLKAEIDGKAVEGRLLYALAADNRPPRLEAELKAAELDVDRIAAFARSAVAGAAPELPGETVLAVEIGRATFAGVDARNTALKLRLDADGLLLERVAIGDLGGAALSLTGRIENLWATPRGSVALDLDAGNLDGPLALLAKFAPQAAETMRGFAPRLVPLRTRATLSLAADRGVTGVSKLAVEGTTGPVRVRLNAEVAGDPLAATSRLDGELTADDGSALARLFGLDRAVTVDRRPGRVSFEARGAVAGELRVDARFTAGGFAAAANGTVRPLALPSIGAGLDLTVTADAAPLLRRNAAVPIALRTRLTATGGAIKLDDLSGTIAGAPVRGNLDLILESPLRVEGRLDADTLDATALMAAALGMREQTNARGQAVSPQPAAPVLLEEARGRIALSASRAMLTPDLAARQMRANVRLGNAETTFEDIDGELAGGRIRGELTFRALAEGVGAHARLVLTDVDASAVIPNDARAALAGRLSVQAEADGTGLTPAALIGSLTGTGTATLTGGQISGFDPKTFDVAIRAVDQGLPADAVKIKDIVAAALNRGALRVDRADGAFSIAAGQARLSTTIMRGEGADLTVAGSLGLAERVLDGRLVFSGPSADSNVGRPEIHAALRGPVAAARRTVDATAFAAWLTVRAIDRETKRIDALEATAREAATASAARPETFIGRPSASALPLPPATKIRPAPAPPSQARPRPRASLVVPAPSGTLRPPINISPTVQGRGD